MTCPTGKLPYPRRSLADKSARTQPGLTSYRCRLCHQFHLGRKPPGIRAERTALRWRELASEMGMEAEG